MIFLGDCLEILRNLESESVDSLVTDPPAGISFMGKDWDHHKGGRDAWIGWLQEVMIEVLRVLKPGAHGLVWALPRTSHWTAFACERAGFEIRDCITHIFGSGFPKSHNVGKSTEAKQWEGYGTALKPASEHWWLIRKPLGEKTVAKNVLKHGTGALNIDTSRIEPLGMDPRVGKGISYGDSSATTKFGQIKSNMIGGSASGRFPANLIVDESAVAELDRQSGLLKSGGGDKGNRKGNKGIFGRSKDLGFSHEYNANIGSASRFFYCPKASKRDKNEGLEGMPTKKGSCMNGDRGNPNGNSFTLTERANHHPTVKNTKLMEYLVTMITPPGGTVLDPFMGSGSTGVAASRKGFDFLGIERELEYFKISESRLEHEAQKIES